MYTRSYFQDDVEISVPKNYDGNAFIEKEKQKDDSQEASCAAPHFEKEGCCERKKEEKRDTGAGFIPSILEKLPFSNLFDRFNFSKEVGFELGKEEILIIAISLFLIFSGGGDVECAIMLLLLLLIK